MAEPIPTPTPTSTSRRRLLIRGLTVLAIVALVWLLAAYVVLPALWRHYEHHPAFENAPKTTLTTQGIPGDPLNVGLIGSEEDADTRHADLGLEPGRPGDDANQPPDRP